MSILPQIPPTGISPFFEGLDLLLLSGSGFVLTLLLSLLGLAMFSLPTILTSSWMSSMEMVLEDLLGISCVGFAEDSLSVFVCPSLIQVLEIGDLTCRSNWMVFVLVLLDCWRGEFVFLRYPVMDDEPALYSTFFLRML